MMADDEPFSVQVGMPGPRVGPARPLSALYLSTSPFLFLSLMAGFSKRTRKTCSESLLTLQSLMAGFLFFENEDGWICHGEICLDCYRCRRIGKLQPPPLLKLDARH